MTPSGKTNHADSLGAVSGPPGSPPAPPRESIGLRLWQAACELEYLLSGLPEIPDPSRERFRVCSQTVREAAVALSHATNRFETLVYQLTHATEALATVHQRCQLVSAALEVR